MNFRSFRSLIRVGSGLSFPKDWPRPSKFQSFRGSHSGHRSQSASDSSIILSGQSLRIKLNGTNAVKLPYVWLRDSCPCPSCVHPSTRQKLHRTSDVPVDIKPSRAQWNLQNDACNLLIEWDRPLFRHDTGSEGLHGHPVGQDAQLHTSIYSRSFIEFHASSATQDIFHCAAKTQMVPWLKAKLEEQESLFLPYESVKSSRKVFQRALTQITHSGLLILTEVPNTIPSKGDEWELRNVANLFSHIRETFYGPLWDVKSLPKITSKNIAYTDLDLDLHMDLLYFENPPRYQLLHCLRNRHVVGGESIFVDALQAAETLFSEDPAAFKILAETDVQFWYVNDGHHLKRKHKTIVVDGVLPDGRPRVAYVNYSPPFQSPLPLNTTRKEFYPALQTFASLLRRANGRWEHLMKEGELAIFDNRRVLHARRAFSETRNGDSGEPNRWLKGCYVEAEPIWDRIRALGVDPLS